MKRWQRPTGPARRRKKEGTGKHLNKIPPHWKWYLAIDISVYHNRNIRNI